MSRVKIKKLSTGVTKLSLSGVNLSPHIKKKKNKINNLKKEKRKKDFPALKAGNGSTPETTQKSPNLSLGVAKEEKSENAGVGFVLVDILLCKNGKVNSKPIFHFFKKKGKKWRKL